MSQDDLSDTDFNIEESEYTDADDDNLIDKLKDSGERNKCSDTVLENFIKNNLSRPFSRKLQFLYTGVLLDTKTTGTFILSNMKDTKFKFCDASQATGLVTIHNQLYKDKLLLLLSTLTIDVDIPGMVYFNNIIGSMNHVGWDISKLVVLEDINHNKFISFTTSTKDMVVPIFKTIESHFIIVLLTDLVNNYQTAFRLDTDIPYVDMQLDFDITKLITSDMILPHGIIDKPCNNFRLMLLQGNDLINTKSIDKPEISYVFTTGVRLWKVGPNCINYGSYYRNSDITLCCIRDNVYIFPTPKVNIME